MTPRRNDKSSSEPGAPKHQRTGERSPPHEGRPGHIPHWAQLPYTVLVEVFLALTDEDRVNAALVCRSWREALADPMLWRVRDFTFGGPRNKCSGKRAVHFARQHGTCLRDVVIRCTHVTSSTCENIAKRLKQFLQVLQAARLKSFRLKELELNRFWRHAHLRIQSAQWLASFLESQRQLEVLEVSNSQFDLLSGLEILVAVAEASGSNLKLIDIEDFFQGQLNVVGLPSYVETIKRFTNLREVSLCYCCISDEVVFHWSYSLKGILRRLSIKTTKSELHRHTITNSSWARLARACPKLIVRLLLYEVAPSRQVIPVLQPAMPLHGLQYWAGFLIEDDMELGLDRTLLHLGSYFARTLRELDFNFDNLQDNINQALVTLVTKCERLESITVRAILTVSTVQTLCLLALERQRAVKHVEIIVRELAMEDTDDLIHLRRQMAPMAARKNAVLILKDALVE